MKKTVKILAIVAFLLVVLLSLTACGGDKLVATKTTEEMGMKYEEKIEISFKDDKINNVKMTMECEDKETAEGIKALFSFASSMGDEDFDFEVEQKGKKVIIEMDAEAFADTTIYGDVESTKEELKEALEEDGYKVK